MTTCVMMEKQFVDESSERFKLANMFIGINLNNIRYIYTVENVIAP